MTDLPMVRAGKILETTLRADMTSFCLPFSILREYAPEIELPDGEDRTIVLLQPKPAGAEIFNARDGAYPTAFTLFVLKRVLQERRTVETDILLNFVGQLCAWLLGHDQIDEDGEQITLVEEPAEDPEVGLYSEAHLRELGQFTAAINFAYAMNRDLDE